MFVISIAAAFLHTRQFFRFVSNVLCFSSWIGFSLFSFSFSSTFVMYVFLSSLYTFSHAFLYPASSSFCNEMHAFPKKSNFLSEFLLLFSIDFRRFFLWICSCTTTSSSNTDNLFLHLTVLSLHHPFSQLLLPDLLFL